MLRKLVLPEIKGILLNDEFQSINLIWCLKWLDAIRDKLLI